MQLQIDVDNKEEYKNCSDDILADEYLAAARKDFNLASTAQSPVEMTKMVTG
jgi:hypothetical protein